MTELRFTITDRTGTAFIFPEIPGYDKDIVDIKRDLDWHGIFFGRQGQLLRYGGEPGRMLKKEYDTYGVQGEMHLTIEEACDDVWLISDTGKFVFGAYKYFCGDECYVTCPLEAIGEETDLRNRMNQKVNLESLKSFDEATDLAPYAKLPFSIALPSKGVLLQDKYLNENVGVTPVAGAPWNDLDSSLHVGNSEVGMIDFGCDKLVAAEIGSFSMRSLPFYNCLVTFTAEYSGAGCNNYPWFDLYPSVAPNPGTNVNILMLSPIVNYAEGTTEYGVVSGTVDLNINLHADLTPLQVTTLKPLSVLCILPGNKTGELVTDYIFLQVLDNSTSIIYHDPVFVLNPGDRIYAFIQLYHFRSEAQTLSGLPAFNISNQVGDFFSMSTLTHTAQTTSKVFAINEVLSRIAESYTNNKLRVYSDLYGRTDSEPYSTGVDGCGSLKVITNGLRIRRAENRIPDKPSVYSLSMEDAFDGLNPIDAIGMGIEPDTRREGFNCLRVEQWEHFYNDTIIMECIGVRSITRSCYAKNIYSTYKGGYEKWEAEQYNGLDEFLTERYWRTGLSQVKNDLVQLSRFISSGYALEVTRRLANYTSQDWRYDDDTFIMCVKRNTDTRAVYLIQQTDHTMTITASFGLTYDELVDIFSIGKTVSFYLNPTPGSISDFGPLTITGQAMYGVSGGVTITTTEVIPGFITGLYYALSSESLKIELGNISGPQNIIDPGTIYNWRIRPVYNAMRWMSWILQSYKQFTVDSKLIFMDGKGNYQALGEMLSTFCKLENQPISEDDMLNLQKFVDLDDCKPIIAAERVQFDFEMSTKDYLAIKANRYGLIHFTGGADCEDDYGYIDQIKYDRTEGMANFLLIPKITT